MTADPSIAYGVAGPRRPDTRQRRIVQATIHDLTDANEVVSGAAVGVDTICALAADEHGVRVRLTIPRVRVNGYDQILPCNQYLLTIAAERGWIVEYGPAKPNASAGYLARNELTVARSASLVAFPYTPVEEQRSGTWACVRRARRAGIPIRFVPLDGTEPFVETPERLF